MVVVYPERGKARLACCQPLATDWLTHSWLLVRWPWDLLAVPSALLCLAVVGAFVVRINQTVAECFVCFAFLCVLLVFLFVGFWRGTAYKALRLVAGPAARLSFDVSVGLLRNYLEKWPATSEVCNTLGVLLARRCEWWEACRLLQQAASLDPHDFVSRGNHAFVLWQLGEVQEGLPLVEGARKIKPSDFLNAWLASQILLELGQLEEAKVQYNSAKKLRGSWLWTGPFIRAARTQLLEELHALLASNGVNAD